MADALAADRLTNAVTFILALSVGLTLSSAHAEDETAETKAATLPDAASEEPADESAPKPSAGSGEEATEARAESSDEAARAPTSVAEVSAGYVSALAHPGHERAMGPPDRVDAKRRCARVDMPAPDKRLLHKFRLGYSFIANADAPDPNEPTRTVKEGHGLASAHLLVIGYEVFYRMAGHDWLYVILVGNVSVAGLKQSA